LREERSLDQLDLKLLRILEEDSRTPWSRIARELGVSETTVYLRVRKLMDMGVLEGFTAKINPSKLGLLATAYILLKVKADSLEQLKRNLAENPHVIEAYEVFAGEYNLLLKLIARNQEEAAESIDGILSLPGVQGALTIYAVRTVKSKKGVTEVVLRSS